MMRASLECRRRRAFAVLQESWASLSESADGVATACQVRRASSGDESPVVGVLTRAFGGDAIERWCLGYDDLSGSIELIGLIELELLQ